MATSPENNFQKKDPFENLSKEELVKKCKHLLGIAQKAKQVKDDLADEHKSLTNALTKLENKSRNDMQAMQEMLDALTQQKLTLVTENDTLKKQLNLSETSLKNIQSEYTETKLRAETLETENEGVSRQVKRLTDENDQLISHLDILEKQINELNKIGEQQRSQLLSLEEKSILSNNKVEINLMVSNHIVSNVLLKS